MADLTYSDLIGDDDSLDKLLQKLVEIKKEVGEIKQSAASFSPFSTQGMQEIQTLYSKLLKLSQTYNQSEQQKADAKDRLVDVIKKEKDSLKGLAAQLKLAKIKQSELTEEQIRTTSQGKRLQSQIERLSGRIKSLNQEERASIKTKTLIRDAEKFRVGSLKQLQAQLALNKAALSIYTAEEIKASSVLKIIAARTAEISKKLRERNRLLNGTEQQKHNVTIADAYIKQKRLASQLATVERMWQSLPPTVRANTTALVNHEKAVAEIKSKMAELGKITGVTTFKHEGFTKSVSDGFRTLRRVAATYASFFTLLRSGQKIESTVVALDSIELSTKRVVGSNLDYIRTQEFVNKVVQDYGLDLLTTQKAFTRFLAASKSSVLQLKEKEQIFASVSKAASVMGLTIERQDLVFNALEQMMSKGKVSSEELRRQLGDSLPGSVEIMAVALGKTTQELDDMLKKGEVLSSEALPKFAKQLEIAYGIESLDKVNNLASAKNRLNTEITKFIDALEADGVIKSFYDIIASGVKYLRQNITTLITLAKALGVVLGVYVGMRFITPLLAGITKATTAYTAITTAQAVATTNAARAQNALNLAMSASPYGFVLRMLGLISVAIGAIIFAIDNYKKSLFDLDKLQKEFAEENEKSSRKLQAQKSIIEDGKTAMEVRKSVLADLKQSYPEYFSLIDLEKSKQEELNKAFSDTTKSIEAQNSARIRLAELEKLEEKKSKLIQQGKEYAMGKNLPKKMVSVVRFGGTATEQMSINEALAKNKAEIDLINKQIEEVNSTFKGIDAPFSDRNTFKEYQEEFNRLVDTETKKQKELREELENLNAERKEAIKLAMMIGENVDIVNSAFDIKERRLREKYSSGRSSSKGSDDGKAERDRLISDFEKIQEINKKAFAATKPNEIEMMEYGIILLQEKLDKMKEINAMPQFSKLEQIDTGDISADIFLSNAELEFAKRSELRKQMLKEVEDMQEGMAARFDESSKSEADITEFQILLLKDKIDQLKAINEEFSDMEQVDLSGLMNDLLKLQQQKGQNTFDSELTAAQLNSQIAVEQAKAAGKTQDEINKIRLKGEIQFLKKKLALHKKYGKYISNEEKELLLAQIEALKQEMSDAVKESGGLKDRFLRFIGLDDPEKIGLANDAMKTLASTWQEIGRIRMQAAEQNLREKNNELEQAQKNLDIQLRLDEQGFASNVELARKQEQEARQRREDALEEQKKAAKEQQRINEITAASNIVTAISNAFKIGGLLGPILAAGLLGSYVVLRARAKSIRRKGTDGVETVKGTRHEAGNDTYLGYNDGTGDVYAEYGEGHAVFTPSVMKQNGKQINKAVSLMQKGFMPNFGVNMQSKVSEDKYGALIFGELVKANGEKKIEYDNKGRVVRSGKNIYTYA